MYYIKARIITDSRKVVHMLIIIDLIVFLILYRFIFYKKWSTESRSKLILKTIMFVYITLVLFATILPLDVTLSTNNYFLNSINLEPFIDYKMQYGGALRQIILNIIMFIPFGFLLPQVSKRRFIGVMIFSLMFTLSIECTQLLKTYVSFSGRIFDVTDMITNFTGGVIGYILYAILRPLINKVYSSISKLYISN